MTDSDTQASECPSATDDEPPTQPAPATLDAAYLHARNPADARIAFYGPDGAESARQQLPAELREVADAVDFEVLLPTEESTLKPLLPDGSSRGSAGARVAPGLWQLPGVVLDLPRAAPWLASLAPDPQRSSLSFLACASQLAIAMLRQGDFAAASSGSGLLKWVPHWNLQSMRCLGVLAEAVPESLLTSRFARPDEPVYAVTPRNLAVSFVGHVLDSLGAGFTARFEEAERLPKSFWQTRPTPVLDVIQPDQELEEGMPWAVQLRFCPVPGLSLSYSFDTLEERQKQRLFPDALTTDSLREVEVRMEELARRMPALRRALNMSDGRASLNRTELDQILEHLPLLEGEGVRVAVPGVEQLDRLAARVSLQEVGAEDGRPWFEFNWRLALGDRELSDEEFRSMVTSVSPLVKVGKASVLLSPKDRDALAEFEKRAQTEGRKIGFFEALRLKLGGATHLHGLALEAIDAGPRLEELASNLELARSIEDRPQPAGFIGELRPYQRRGHAWVYYLIDQGFGACLADDMGLGKTIQAIAVILDWRRDETRREPILLVCPVSVLGNWRRELQRFGPELGVAMHHGKTRPRTEEGFAQLLKEHNVILTSYHLLQRDEALILGTEFGGVILDEAHNIKNPRTRQSRAARKLRGRFRIALTGTPLENRPLDLWSIMDFLNEGLLGNRSQFLQSLEHPIVKQRNQTTMSTLARLVRPFVLRRLKTDPEIVHDLPEKSEQVVAASLTREQVMLYENTVRRGLADVEGADENIQRRGAILTTLLRLKQVCNHPAHYLMDGSALPGRSGKLDLLTEMLEEALAEGDRCLVFTQFKEMGALLKTHIEGVVQERILFLHGSVPQKERESMVAEFQAPGDDAPRIFVLSLKAGGTGLNLTRANRVFHFDRWWNPAVEDQATDRAFRIGQQRNVFVHKFVCTGTLEERIQVMLERKREVAENLLGTGEGWLTELSNDELRKLLLLDRSEALT
ncbi:MAG: DEAD/DEAH box helicase [Planctomycetota bacterium]